MLERKELCFPKQLRKGSQYNLVLRVSELLHYLDGQYSKIELEVRQLSFLKHSSRHSVDLIPPRSQNTETSAEQPLRKEVRKSCCCNWRDYPELTVPRLHRMGRI